MAIEPLDSIFEVHIHADQPVYKLGDEVVIETTVTNVSAQKGKFCTYHTPFEGIKNEIFTLMRNGKPIPYQGIMKKRVPPSDNDYKTLAPGAQAVCKVTLSKGYTLNKKGNYTIAFLGSVINGLPSSATQQFTVS